MEARVHRPSLNTPPRPCRYAEGERTNARWAMIAVAGILGAEALGVPVKWFEAGAKYDASAGIPILGLLAIQQVLFGFLELNRFAAYKGGGWGVGVGRVVGGRRPRRSRLVFFFPPPPPQARRTRSSPWTPPA